MNQNDYHMLNIWRPLAKLIFICFYKINYNLYKLILCQTEWRADSVSDMSSWIRLSKVMGTLLIIYKSNNILMEFTHSGNFYLVLNSEIKIHKYQFGIAKLITILFSN